MNRAEFEGNGAGTTPKPHAARPESFATPQSSASAESGPRKAAATQAAPSRAGESEGAAGNTKASAPPAVLAARPSPSPGLAASPLKAPTRHSDKAAGRLSQAAAARWEDELRGRLGLLPLGHSLAPAERKRGWILTAILALVAALTRLVRLGHPHELIFDETYYVKDAYSLLHHGFEAAWAEDVNDAFASGDFSGLDPANAEYVVHPPFGKWLMAFGQALFGSDTGFGWRFATALLGVAAVVLVVRIALRMFRSPLLAGLAGLAVALDGMGIVMSRTGILDNILAFFILAGFWAILHDREHSRARLAHEVAHGYLTASGQPRDVWGPNLFYRPWLLVAGVLLGLSAGVKWSGIYAVAVFGILVFVWGLLARRAVGVPLFWGAGVFREGLPAFVQLVPTAALAYVAAWTSWFASSGAWDRSWASTTSDPLPVSWLPDTVNSWLHYHKTVWEFHNGLETPHDYASKPWLWIVQGRPVSFYWKGTDEMSDVCANSDCVQAITSVGNIAVWWLGLAAFVVVLALGAKRRDWRAGAIVAGYAATYFPWFVYAHRTIFQFYAITLLPFVAFALAWAIGAVGRSMGAAHAPASEMAEVLAGLEEAWLAGVRVRSSVDPDVALPDFPAREVGADPQGEAVGAAAGASGPASGAAARPLAAEFPPLASTAGEALEADAVCEAREEDRNVFARALGALFASPAETGAERAGWWQERPTSLGLALATATAVLIVIVAAAWYPLWTGATVSYDFWHMHMFFDSWI